VDERKGRVVKREDTSPSVLSLSVLPSASSPLTASTRVPRLPRLPYPAVMASATSSSSSSARTADPSSRPSKPCLRASSAQFMPPVTLDSYDPHPVLPFQPDKSLFIVAPVKLPSPPPSVPLKHPPKNILAAARTGDLDSLKAFCQGGQTEMADSMGEVRFTT